MEENKIKRFLGLPLIWAVVLGLVGFGCGFFGPIFLNPSSNIAPLVGILITGPGAFVLGGVLGFVAAIIGLQLRTHFYAIGAASIVVAMLTLYMSTPEDKYLGIVIDGEVRGCKSPKYLVAGRIEWWQKLIDKNTWRKPRQGWREDIDMALDKDDGVVLEMFVYRQSKFYESRKPWNSGTIKVSAWEKPQKIIDYYARSNGRSCESYKTGIRSLYYPKWEASRVSPPDILPTFLGLHVLNAVPAKYQNLVQK